MVPKMRTIRTRRCVIVGLALSTWMAATVSSATARAQVHEPGAHRRYAVELEPQVALKWAGLPGDAAGIGPGLRMSVPILQDGPLAKLNNSLAIGLGIHWAYFQEPCGAYFWEGPSPEPDDPNYATFIKDCTAHQFTAPLVVQWNFFLTPVISIFAEPGIALVHERRSGTGWCDEQPCSKDDNSTKLPFAVWGGARLAMSDSLALTIRLGSPYVSAGASLFF